MVSLEANIKKYESSLAKALNQTNGTARGIEKRFNDMNKKVGQSFDFGGAAARGLGVLGLGVSAAGSFKAISAAAQEYTSLQNALKVTGLEGAALERTFGSLFQIAQKNGTAIAPLTTLYSRAAQAQKELNASSADLLKFTDGVSVALRVAGTSSTQASGALLQLSQAIGGGIVRAEEFNSVNEGARPILQAVAAGLTEAGGSVSKLKTLVTEGKVSSEAFFRAFLAGMPQLESQVSKADATIGQASARIANAFTLLVGKLDETVGASKNAASNLSALGSVVESLPGYFDAAAKKLGEFQSYLTQLGNSSVWSKIATFMGADLSPEGLRKAGITPPQDFAGPGGRIAEGARDRLGQAPAAAAAPKIKPVSLKDFKIPGKEGGGKESADAFERSVAQIERRTAVLNAETAAVDLGAAAQQRARVQTELETAAKKANEAAGLKNTEVTEAQRAKITALADAYMRAAEAAAAANAPLMQFARSAKDTQGMMQEFAVGGLRTVEDALVDIATMSGNAAEAFKKMAASIIADLARIAIRQAITGPIAGALGGIFGGGGGGSIGNSLGGSLAYGGARASGGPVTGGKAYLVGEKRPELFVPNRSGMILPSVPGASGGPNVTVGGTSIVVQGNADEQTLALMQREFARRDAQMPGRVVSAVRQARKAREL